MSVLDIRQTYSIGWAKYKHTMVQFTVTFKQKQKTKEMVEVEQVP